MLLMNDGYGHPLSQAQVLTIQFERGCMYMPIVTAHE